MYIHLKDGTGRLITKENVESELRDMLEEYCGREALNTFDYFLELKTEDISEEIRKEYEEFWSTPDDTD